MSEEKLNEDIPASEELQQPEAKRAWFKPLTGLWDATTGKIS
ncbi:MAG: hypothetical protein ACRC6M_08105 [Microcystaceae cyanobacterium]